MNNEPICLYSKCTKPAKILSCRIKGGKKFCSTTCGAMYAIDNTMNLKWCSKHEKWEDEETDCSRMIPTWEIP